MKSLIIYMVELFRRKAQVMFAIAGLMAFLSPAALAGDGAWSLDSSASDARFYQGSATNPRSSNVGVARVEGKVVLDPNDLQNSRFNVSIYPADEEWETALTPDGTLTTRFVPGATDHTLLTFTSKSIQKTGDGKLQVSGDLTLTRVERSVSMSGGGRLRRAGVWEARGSQRNSRGRVRISKPRCGAFVRRIGQGSVAVGTRDRGSGRSSHGL